MKEYIFLLFFAFGLFFTKIDSVKAQAGCCVGNVVTRTAECPNPGTSQGWYCVNTSTAYSCSGMDYSTCINTRPTSSADIECGSDVPNCTGCGWSATCSGSGGGGGGCDWSQVNCPAGTVKNTSGGYTDYCGEDTYCPRPGTQQEIAGGCGGEICLEEECSIRPNGTERCDCIKTGFRRQIIRTYNNCIPVCTAVSPWAL